PLDQRQSRTVQPHTAHRIRLLPPLDLQPSPPRGLARMGPALQHSTSPFRPRRQTPDQPTTDRGLKTTSTVTTPSDWSGVSGPTHPAGRARAVLAGRNAHEAWELISR